MTAAMANLIVLSTMVAAPAGGTSAPAPKDPFKLYAIEMRLIERTNAMRVAHGRAPLAVDHQLVRSARRHTIWMVRSRHLQHTSALVAENIAMGQTSADQVVQDWMTSPGHRANILNPEHRRIGVAAYRAPDGTIYWCQQFLR